MNQQHPKGSIAKSSGVSGMPLLTSLFFIWGFITCLNDMLVPHLKAVFTLNYAQAMLIQFCFFSAYFIVSVPSGYLVEKIGYKGGIVTGLTVAGLGCLLFYPAAAFRLYPLFLAALFVLAAGITILQVSANPYVTLLGNAETASSRLAMTQAFNSLGTTLAPYFGSFFILSTTIKTNDEIKLLSPDALVAYQTAEASAVQQPYLLLAAVLFVVALTFIIARLPVANTQPSKINDAEILQSDSIYPSAWHCPHLVLGAIGIFLYVGAEVSIGSFLVNFITQPEITGLTPADAAKYVSFYWGGAMVGRFLGALAMQKIQPGKALAFNALCAASLVLITLLMTGYHAMWAILSIGLFNSIMFPTIFSLSLRGLGLHAGQGSGILCAAIVGGAILPVLQGFLADNIGIQPAFILPVLCYFYIAFYGLKGCHIGVNPQPKH